MPNDPTHDLQSAARRFAGHVCPGVCVGRVKVFAIDGATIATIPVPPPGEPVVVEVSKAGWDFSGTVPRFDGTLVPVHGRKAEILKLLVAGPMLAKHLRDALDTQMSEGTARWHVSDLREALIALFPGLEDPISSTPEGYVLQIR